MSNSDSDTFKSAGDSESEHEYDETVKRYRNKATKQFVGKEVAEAASKARADRKAKE